MAYRNGVEFNVELEYEIFIEIGLVLFEKIIKNLFFKLCAFSDPINLNKNLIFQLSVKFHTILIGHMTHLDKMGGPSWKWAGPPETSLKFF